MPGGAAGEEAFGGGADFGGQGLGEGVFPEGDDVRVDGGQGVEAGGEGGGVVEGLDVLEGTSGAEV